MLFQHNVTGGKLYSNSNTILSVFKLNTRVSNLNTPKVLKNCILEFPIRLEAYSNLTLSGCGTIRYLYSNIKTVDRTDNEFSYLVFYLHKDVNAMQAQGSLAFRNLSHCAPRRVML